MPRPFPVRNRSFAAARAGGCGLLLLAIILSGVPAATGAGGADEPPAGATAAAGAGVPAEAVPALSVQDSAPDAAAGDGSAVVMIPSFMGCAYGYRHVVAELNRAGLRTVVVEPLGVGDSPRPRGADYTLTAQAARIGTALDRLGVGRAILVANGAAASLAFRLALARPELVAGIVSLEGTPAETLGTPGMCRALSLVGLAGKLAGRQFMRERLRQALQEASGDASWLEGITFRRYYASYGRDLDTAIATLQAMTSAEEPEPLAPRLPRVSCPVVLLAGEAPHTGAVDDPEIARMDEALSDFSVRRLPGCGHFVMEERPGEVVAAVRELAPRLVASRAGGGAGKVSAP